MITSVSHIAELSTSLAKSPVSGLATGNKSLNINNISGLSGQDFKPELIADWAVVPSAMPLPLLPAELPGGKLLPGNIPVDWLSMLENPQFIQQSGLSQEQLGDLREAILAMRKQGQSFSLDQLSLSKTDSLTTAPEMDIDLQLSYAESLKLKQAVLQYAESTARPAFSNLASLASHPSQALANIPIETGAGTEQLLLANPGTQLIQRASAANPYSQVLSVDTALTQPNWQEAFNSRVMMLARDHRQLAHIQINPPELGPVEIRMSLNAEQTHVQFIAQHAVVRDAIEEAFPRLREMMEASGLSLGDVNVSDQAAGESEYAQDSDAVRLLADGQETSTESHETENRVISVKKLGLVDQYV